MNVWPESIRFGQAPGVMKTNWRLTPFDPSRIRSEIATAQMLKIPTVFVLGAGASAPYGYPVGRVLVEQIVTRGVPEGSVLHTNAFREFQTILKESGADSIDAFLERRTDLLPLGKLAIAHALIGYEQHERLWEDTRITKTGPVPIDNWYKYLLNKLLVDVPFDKLAEMPISFVTFNYDRSLEHFLFTALMRRYGKPEQDVAAVLQRIPIVHVYGDLGPLPWQTRQGVKIRPYAAAAEALVKEAASQIQILHEGESSSANFQE